MDFVWDYGALSEKEENLYVYSMFKKSVATTVQIKTIKQRSNHAFDN